MVFDTHADALDYLLKSGYKAMSESNCFIRQDEFSLEYGLSGLGTTVCEIIEDNGEFILIYPY